MALDSTCCNNSLKMTGAYAMAKYLTVFSFVLMSALIAGKVPPPHLTDKVIPNNLGQGILKINTGTSQRTPSVDVIFNPSTGVVGGTQEFVCVIYTLPPDFAFLVLVWDLPSTGLMYNHAPGVSVPGTEYVDRIDPNYDSHLIVPTENHPGYSWIRINRTDLCDSENYRCKAIFDSGAGFVEAEANRDLPFQDPEVKVTINGEIVAPEPGHCIPFTSINTSEPASVVVTVTQATSDPTVDLSIKDSKGNIIDPGTSIDTPSSDPATCSFGKESTFTALFPDNVAYTLTTTLTVDGSALTPQSRCFFIPVVRPHKPYPQKNPTYLKLKEITVNEGDMANLECPGFTPPDLPPPVYSLMWYKNKTEKTRVAYYFTVGDTVSGPRLENDLEGQGSYSNTGVITIDKARVIDGGVYECDFTGHGLKEVVLIVKPLYQGKPKN